MPFGISTAPEHFQQRLDQRIEGLPGVRMVVDDILISDKGDSVAEAMKDHDQKLLTLLKSCKGKGIKKRNQKLLSLS